MYMSRLTAIRLPRDKMLMHACTRVSDIWRVALVLAHGMEYTLIVQSPVIFTGTYYGASHFQNTLMTCLIILQLRCGCMLLRIYMNHTLPTSLPTHYRHVV